VISKRIASVLIPTGLWAVSCSASAQIVNIGFGQSQAIATPLSPWTAGGAAVLLALAAWAFLRRKRGPGLLLLALAVLAGVVTSRTQEANALSPCTALTQPSVTGVGCLILTAPSPDVTLDYRFEPSFGSGFIDVTNGVGAPVTISSIQVTDGLMMGVGWAVVNPVAYMAPTPFFTQYAPTCTVGLTLAAGGRCSLYLYALTD
jgi:hypothetical protein